jgi:S1-C subfamily serine protease
MVNSDNIEVGEWVLAMGNPFTLNSTVTAGIVSAKSRNINILREQYAIESFIQTDAAINPGNSGGALVNMQGGLVGINTAIASPTGAYSGYGFAVPSNIVNKVVSDLLEYGIVQRGYLGITIRDVSGELAVEEDLDLTEGVYIDSIMAESAAAKAGLKVGDVIIKVEDNNITKASELQEMIALYRPGDKVELIIDRDGNVIQRTATLQSIQGNTELASEKRGEMQSILGAELVSLSREDARELNIDGGVKITKLYAGKLRSETNIREGFIITHVNTKSVSTMEELTNILQNTSGGVMLEGVYENDSEVHYYAFGL